MSLRPKDDAPPLTFWVWSIRKVWITSPILFLPYRCWLVPALPKHMFREQFGEARVGKYPFARNHRAHAIQPPIGFVKLIVGPPGDDRILGVRVVGPNADTIVGAASIMIERNFPYTYILESIFPHPSLLEALKGAAHIIAGDALQYEEGEELSTAQAPGG